MIGLRRGTVALYAHEPEWDEEARRTVLRLREILGDAAKDMQHVGSTAVSSIRAKPIIDIAVAVESFEAILALEPKLQAAGFYFRPGADIPDQLLFACGSWYDGTGDLQTHFIHVVLENSDQWNDYIAFRDYLNATPSAAKAYEALKLSLAEKAPVDAGRKQYLQGKHDFISQALEKARAFRAETRKEDSPCVKCI